MLTMVCDICGNEIARGQNEFKLKAERDKEKRTVAIRVFNNEEKLCYMDICSECAEAIIACIESRKVTSHDHPSK